MRCSAPQISVILITFNQSNYVERAIEGLLAQNYDLTKVEVVVADDASADGTVDMIKKHLPEDRFFRVRYLSHLINVGITKNYQRSIEACEGEFIAIIEGDDYWTSPMKLSKQINLLQRRHEFVACGSNYYIFEVEKNSFNLRIHSTHGYSTVNAISLISDNVPGNFSTMVYRAKSLKKLPKEVFSLRAFDWIFHILLSQDSQICILHDPMSVYRVHQSGQWSGLSGLEKRKQMAADMATYAPLCAPFVASIMLQKKDLILHDIAIAEMPLRRKVTSLRYIRFAASLCVPPLLSAIFKSITPPIIPFTFRRAHTIIKKRP